MKLKELRENAGLSKTEISRRLGVTLSTVCHWERGAAIPRTNKLPLLADMFGCTIDELYGRDQAEQEGEPQVPRQTETEEAWKSLAFGKTPEDRLL